MTQKRKLPEARWVPVEERLPEIGEKVEVKGRHTPDGMGWPISYRSARQTFMSHHHGNLLQHWNWESTEWRGTVAITHWRPVPAVPLAALEKRGVKVTSEQVYRLQDESEITGVLGADNQCYSDADPGL